MDKSNLFTTDVTVTEIEYVWNGLYMPRSLHMVNRGYHGLVLVRADPHSYIFDDGTVLRAEPGCILYLPKGSSYRLEEPAPCDCVAINFTVAEETDFQPFLYPVGAQMPAYSELYQTASRYWDGKYIGYRAKIKSILYQILYEMQAHYTPEYMPRKTTDMLNGIVDYIGEHYTDRDISVVRLAEMAGMSEVYFRRLFQQMYRMSPLQYIKQLRLSRAIELLESDMYPMHEVAHRVGYQSEYYFCREFKRITGLSPTKFKKEMVDRQLYDVGFPYSHTEPKTPEVLSSDKQIP